MSKMSETTKIIYTCIKELDEKAEVKLSGMEPWYVYVRLPDLKNAFEAAKKKGDDETAYIMLKKWLNCVFWLQKMSSLKKDKANFAAQIIRDEINKVKNILADLTQKLERGTSTDDPLHGNKDKFISCNTLLNIIGKKGRYLIIDIREKVHYDDSKIMSKKCINIPQSEIPQSQQGIVARHFLTYLRKHNKRSAELFSHRSDQYVDMVILLDWYTTQESLTISSGLNKLKDILLNCDPGTRYKKIKILNGGYEKWLTRYPQITVNSNENIPKLNIVENNTVVDKKIDYPELIDLDNKKKILKKVQNANQNKLNNTKAFNNMDIKMD